MEREDEPEEQESTKQESEHPANYYVWSSTGNESVKMSNDNKDDAWGPGGISTEYEGTTEDEEEIQEDQNYIQ